MKSNQGANSNAPDSANKPSRYVNSRSSSLDGSDTPASPATDLYNGNEFHFDSMDSFSKSPESKPVSSFPISAGSPTPSSPVSQAANRLLDALQKLGQVDVILDQLSYFWAHTELVLDALTKKGQHVEQFVGYAKNPRLLARFRERIEEYKRFWEGISLMCNNYVNGVGSADSFSSTDFTSNSM